MNIPRRTFIRSAGISLALPWLDAFAEDSKRSSSSGQQTPRRMVCICAPLGLHPDNFFPAQTGKGYALSPYLEILKDYRDEMTVISGLQHAGMGSSFAHQASASFLTGVPGAGRPGFRNAISLDQFAADKGRYPDSLAELVEARYLRSVPADPATGSTATWIILTPVDPATKGKVYDIRSGAAGRASDGRLLADW